MSFFLLSDLFDPTFIVDDVTTDTVDVEVDVDVNVEVGTRVKDKVEVGGEVTVVVIADIVVGFLGIGLRMVSRDTGNGGGEEIDLRDIGLLARGGLGSAPRYGKAPALS